MNLVRMMRACRRCGLVCAANHCLRTAQRSLAGTLIKIHLENFMCHKNLTIEFVRSLWCHSSRVVRIASLGSGTADSGRQYHQRREWVGQKCGVCCPHGACALVCVCVCERVVVSCGADAVVHAVATADGAGFQGQQNQPREQRERHHSPWRCGQCPHCRDVQQRGQGGVPAFSVWSTPHYRASHLPVRAAVLLCCAVLFGRRQGGVG